MAVPNDSFCLEEVGDLPEVHSPFDNNDLSGRTIRRRNPEKPETEKGSKKEQKGKKKKSLMPKEVVHSFDASTDPDTPGELSTAASLSDDLFSSFFLRGPPRSRPLSPYCGEPFIPGDDREGYLLLKGFDPFEGQFRLFS